MLCIHHTHIYTCVQSYTYINTYNQSYSHTNIPAEGRLKQRAETNSGRFRRKMQAFMPAGNHIIKTYINNSNTAHSSIHTYVITCTILTIYAEKCMHSSIRSRILLFSIDATHELRSVSLPTDNCQTVPKLMGNLFQIYKMYLLL